MGQPAQQGQALQAGWAEGVGQAALLLLVQLQRVGWVEWWCQWRLQGMLQQGGRGQWHAED